MDLSIVIVNYNVKHFLEQCLLSVAKATKNLNTEVFVVDNASVDGSMEMVSEKFPWVKQICNKDNVGFSIANNQAIAKSTGKYVLLLNPDTVVEENCFDLCYEFAEKKEKFGSLTVKMIDGLGRFLPESKRGLPTPAVAFYKIFGLSSIFKNSKRFGKYHLSYLDENETHEIEILPGAYMWMSREVLDKIGYLDESFFMYGEDIDLSYRFILAGYKNYYYPETKIIHYKGESTKKGSLNYVKVFYQAMIIFAEKHFSKSYSSLFRLIILLAVYLRMLLSIGKRIISTIFWPLMDGLASFLLLLVLSEFSGKYTPQNVLFVTGSLQSAVSVLAAVFLGLYNKPDFLKAWLKWILPLGLISLSCYSLLPETLRFSRLVMLLYIPCMAIFSLVSRRLSDALFKTSFFLSRKVKKVACIGYGNEAGILKSKLQDLLGKKLKVVEINHIKEENLLNGFAEIIESEKPDEVIFSGESYSAKTIMQCMSLPLKQQPEIKIAPAGSTFIIGSSSIHSRGQIYISSQNFLGLRKNRRNKRFFDISSAILCLVIFPLLLLFPNGRKVLKNVSRILFKNYTWIGVSQNIQEENIPNNAIFTLADLLANSESKTEEEFQYIKDYKTEKEVYYFLKIVFASTKI